MFAYHTPGHLTTGTMVWFDDGAGDFAVSTFNGFSTPNKFTTLAHFVDAQGYDWSEKIGPRTRYAFDV